MAPSSSARASPSNINDALLEELVQGMKDLRVELAELRPKQGVSTNGTKTAFVHKCIWCDSPDHQRKDCAEFVEALHAGVVHLKEGKIHLTSTGEMLASQFGKGGMKKLIPTSSKIASTRQKIESVVNTIDVSPRVMCNHAEEKFST